MTTLQLIEILYKINYTLSNDLCRQSVPGATGLGQVTNPDFAYIETGSDT